MFFIINLDEAVAMVLDVTMSQLQNKAQPAKGCLLYGPFCSFVYILDVELYALLLQMIALY